MCDSSDSNVILCEDKISVCASCGKENPSGSRFCGYCGYIYRGGEKQDSMKQVDVLYATLAMQRQQLEELKKQTRQQAEEEESAAKCPHCGSKSLVANKKGYGIGKGIVGAAIFGPLGLIAGNMGSDKVRMTCLKCGRQYERIWGRWWRVR